MKNNIGADAAAVCTVVVPAASQAGQRAKDALMVSPDGATTS
ncbi:MAG TPA: hypothetical protein VNR70_02435 [Steroidobacteraceae bacterium]|nr:hypothetical protein [Steroidobacteraceae bacterium]